MAGNHTNDANGGHSQDLLTQREVTARGIVLEASALALSLFRDRDALAIEMKGLRDWVSNADRQVETKMREALLEAFPNDGIVGEEHGNVTSTSGFTWVIDPIDGTSNYVTGSPGWCVVLACVQQSLPTGEPPATDDHATEGSVVMAIIHDPISAELFTAMRGQGAWLNGRALNTSPAQSLSEGSVSVGYSARVPFEPATKMLSSLLAAGGMYQCNGSGAQCLAWVAAGRLIGYSEQHMYAWDCLAALLLIEEAGGRVRPFSLPKMLASGGPVVAAAPGVYDALLALSDTAYPADTA